jgi:hypothetical protein
MRPLLARAGAVKYIGGCLVSLVDDSIANRLTYPHDNTAHAATAATAAAAAAAAGWSIA